MLGKTANGLFWFSREIERMENMAELLETGLRMALMRNHEGDDEWKSVIATVGAQESFEEKHDEYSAKNVIDYILRDKENSSSVINTIEDARSNARLVRTAITRSVWESTNESWMKIKETLRRPVTESQLPNVLNLIKNQSALISGAFYRTMLRNETNYFSSLGRYIERADNTARILDVKYYVLLPSSSYIGSSLDNVQWESILRSVSAHRSYRWVYHTDYNPTNIAEFLILNEEMPRSLAFCYDKIETNLKLISIGKEPDDPSQHHCKTMIKLLDNSTVNSILEDGLHEFLMGFLTENNTLSSLIAQQYRFYE